jgi:hypothetical protein
MTKGCSSMCSFHSLANITQHYVRNWSLFFVPLHISTKVCKWRLNLLKGTTSLSCAVYRFHTRPSFSLNLPIFGMGYNSILCFSKIDLNTFTPSMFMGISVCHLPLKLCVQFSSPCMLHSRSSHTPWFNKPNILGEEYRLWSPLAKFSVTLIFTLF